MQDTQNNHRLQGHLLGAFSVLVWGTTFVATKVLLRTFSPIEIMIARFALGFLALLIVGRGLMRPQKKWHEALFAAAGLTGVTLYFLMENIALTYISASLVGVIVAAAPLFTALIAAVFLKEKLSIWFFCGFVCAMTGITLVSLAGVSELHFSPVGALLTVGAALVWGVYSVLIRVLGHMGPRTRSQQQHSPDAAVQDEQGEGTAQPQRAQPPEDASGEHAACRAAQKIAERGRNRQAAPDIIHRRRQSAQRKNHRDRGREGLLFLHAAPFREERHEKQAAACPEKAVRRSGERSCHSKSCISAQKITPSAQKCARRG